MHDTMCGLVGCVVEVKNRDLSNAYYEIDIRIETCYYIAIIETN